MKKLVVLVSDPRGCLFCGDIGADTKEEGE